MTAYLLKRVLIMVPTFLGVSLMIWLVMTLAPGEPQPPDQGTGDFGGTPEDLDNLEAQARNRRIFREQFGLNRPRFWNGWPDLTLDEVSQALQVKLEGVEQHGVKPVRISKQQLEDWGSFAVPHLVRLLEETAADPKFQTLALVELRKAAYIYPREYRSGHVPSEAEMAEDKKTAEENQLINGPEFLWKFGAPAAERAAPILRWKEWVAERGERWEYTDGEKLKIGLLDTQFGKYWNNLAHGDLGLSYRTSEPVLEMILSRLKYSLSLAVPSFLIAWVMAVFLGVFSASKHGTIWDQGIGVTLIGLYSIPSFVMATVLQRLIASKLDWFPTDGFESPNVAKMNTWEHLIDVIDHITLPIICYTYGALAYISRQARSGMLRVLNEDYVRTARAKGVKERTVVWKHAVRNGMMPIVTLLGTALPVLLGGSVFIEVIFNIDGFGRLMINSIFQKDYNVVMGIALVTSVLTLLGLLLADLIYAAMDPRIALK